MYKWCSCSQHECTRKLELVGKDEICRIQWADLLPGSGWECSLFTEYVTNDKAIQRLKFFSAARLSLNRSDRFFKELGSCEVSLSN